MIPRCTALIPKLSAIGATSGATIMIALMMSMRHPIRSRKMLSRSRKVPRDRSRLVIQSTAASGIAWSTRKWFSANDKIRMISSAPIITVDSTSSSGMASSFISRWMNSSTTKA